MPQLKVHLNIVKYKPNHPEKKATSVDGSGPQYVVGLLVPRTTHTRKGNLRKVLEQTIAEDIEPSHPFHTFVYGDRYNVIDNILKKSGNYQCVNKEIHLVEMNDSDQIKKMYNINNNRTLTVVEKYDFLTKVIKDYSDSYEGTIGFELIVTPGEALRAFLLSTGVPVADEDGDHSLCTEIESPKKPSNWLDDEGHLCVKSVTHFGKTKELAINTDIPSYNDDCISPIDWSALGKRKT